MNEIFGVSMTTITTVLVALLAIALLFVAHGAIRKPVVFKLGARNIPRRKAQTVLIVIGLMLSTLIVASALGLGRSASPTRSPPTPTTPPAGSTRSPIVTTDYDTDNYQDFGEMRPEQADRSSPSSTPTTASTGRSLPSGRGPAINEATQLGEPVVRIVGLDPGNSSGFEDDLPTESGDPDRHRRAAAGSIVDQRQARRGARRRRRAGVVTVYYDERPIPLTVAVVTPSTFLTGQADVIPPTSRRAAVLSLSALRQIVGDDRR
jgi:putative ABC transport system permease protein